MPERKIERKEGIVYSDYMGSGPGNKPSHGGNGYKIGSTVAYVLSLVSVSVSVSMLERAGESRLRAGGAGAKRHGKSKTIGRREATGIREQKARGCAAIRRDERTRAEGEKRERESRRERKDGAATKRNGARERGRHDGRRRTEREPQHREPSYWNLNNNYSV